MSKQKKQHFKTLQEYDTETRLISPRYNNGDWNYYLVIHLIDMHDATGDKTIPKYAIAIEAVSPTAAGTANVKKALEFGWNINGKPSTQQKVLALSEYGIFAQLWTKSGNNKAQLLKAAREEAQIIKSFTFGFKMDCAANALGSTGWDFIKGDITAGLRRYRKTAQKSTLKTEGLTA